MNNESILDFEARKERQESLEHRDTLLAIGAILKTKEGLQVFKYLYKNLEVGEVPERGIEGDSLHDYLGFLRAGNSIYKLVCEADFEISASILSKIEREKYDERNEIYRIQNGLNISDDD